MVMLRVRLVLAGAACLSPGTDRNFQITERYRFQLRWDFQNALKTYNFDPPTRTVDFRNPLTFGKVFGGQPLMNLALAVFF